MNNTFNIQRFGLLLKRQWLEFGKIYLITLGVALGIIVTTYTLCLWSVFTSVRAIQLHNLNFREPLFLIFGLLFLTIIASTYFAHLGQKSRAIIDLMIPASTFEKFLAGILFTSVLATASYLVIFGLVDFAFIAKLRSVVAEKQSLETIVNSRGEEFKLIDELGYLFAKYNPNDMITSYVLPFFVTSVFLLGSVYFNKFHYIKTAISVMIFSGLWTYIVINISEYLMRNKVPVSSNEFNNNGAFVDYWATLLFTALTLIFWAITYVRLKEKEV